MVMQSHHSETEALPLAPNVSGGVNDDVQLLRGWFLKEKRDKFKRRGSIFAGNGSNRRWVTIEHISNADSHSNSCDDRGKDQRTKPRTELALCYYKSSSANEERSGWIFLNDIVSLSQDIPNRWITIDHPTRTLRIQSPTSAQHRVWFSALSKGCKNVNTEDASHSSFMLVQGPSLILGETMSSRANSAKSLVVSTPKDELIFLREITGRHDGKNDDAPEKVTSHSKEKRMEVEEEADEYTLVQSTYSGLDGSIGKSSASCSAKSSPHFTPRVNTKGIEEDITCKTSIEFSERDVVSQTENQIEHEIDRIKSNESESEGRPDVYHDSTAESKVEANDDEVHYFDDSNVDVVIDVQKEQPYIGLRAIEKVNIGTISGKSNSLDACSKLSFSDQRYSTFSKRIEVAKNTKTSAQSINNLNVTQIIASFSDSEEESFGDIVRPIIRRDINLSNSFLAKTVSHSAVPSISGSFSSTHTSNSRSSSYQLHFENGEDDIKPDDDFVISDWDEE